MNAKMLAKMLAKMNATMEINGTIPLIPFFFWAAAVSGCGETKQPWTVNTDTPPDTSSAAEEESDTPSETDKTFPDLPELCVRQTEINAGVEEGQFRLSGSGSAAAPGIAANPETDELLFSYAYIESGAPTWAVLTAPYRTFVETVDGGETVAREVGEISTPSPADAPGRSPSIAYGHGGFGLVWLDGRYDPDCTAENDDACVMDVVFLQLDAAGVASGDPIVLSDAALGRPSGRPTVAAGAEGYWVAWVSTTANESRLAAVQLDDAGKPVDDAFLLEDTPIDGTFSPSIAATETTAIVVYTDERQKGVSARVWSAGEDRPGDPIALSESAGQSKGAVITAGKDGFLAAWAGIVDGKPQVLMRTLDASGAPDGAVEQATWAENVGNPAVASHDDIYVVSWSASHPNGEEKCAVPDWCAEQIFAAVVDGDGHPVAKGVRLSEDANESRNMQISWDGVGFTAVWETWRSSRWQLFFGQMTCE